MAMLEIDGDKPPFSESVERVVERARVIAKKLRHEYITSTHLLYSLLKENDLLVMGCLRYLGCDITALSDEVILFLDVITVFSYKGEMLAQLSLFDTPKKPKKVYPPRNSMQAEHALRNAYWYAYIAFKPRTECIHLLLALLWKSDYVDEKRIEDNNKSLAKDIMFIFDLEYEKVRDWYNRYLYRTRRIPQ